MAHQAQSKVIEDNPIGNGLDAFRSLFNLTCEGRGISHLCVPDALDQLDQEGGYLRPSLVARSLSNLLQMYRILRLAFYWHFKFSLPPAF